MEQSVDCIICNDSEDDHWITTKCGHMYHFQCLQEWAIDFGHKCCPICKRSTDANEWLRIYTTSISRKSNEILKLPVAAGRHVTSVASRPSPTQAQSPLRLAIDDATPFKLSIMDDTVIEHSFKIVLLGDSGTGKTAIWRRFIDDQFNDRMSATIGPEFRGQKVQCCGKCVELQVWDTAGQANFRSINLQYLRKAVGIIFVYAVNDAASCESLRYWMDKVNEVLPPEVAKVMVGNKSDFPPEARRVLRGYGEKIANASGITFFETSAKSSENIQAVFKTLTTLILESPNLVRMADAIKIQRQATIRLHSRQKRGDSRRSKSEPNPVNNPVNMNCC